MTDHAEREREAREAYDNATVYAERMAMGEGVDRSMSTDEAYAELRRVILASARERVEALREKSANVVLAFHDWPGYESDHANGERKRALDDLARAITEAT